MRAARDKAAMKACLEAVCDEAAATCGKLTKQVSELQKQVTELTTHLNDARLRSPF